MSINVLVLGGHGNFGRRICRALSGDTNLRLIVAARNGQRARALARALGGGATGVALDYNAPDFVQRLSALDTAVVIHTAGPYQGQDWRVPMAAARAGAHYIDLADGRQWVCEFKGALDSVFREQGCFATSGASTLPALSRKSRRQVSLV